MANNLTGDFDVVAEFAVLAINRLLAGMHQTGRFMHSISGRVDDNPHPTQPNWPVVVGAVDGFGEAIANQRMIGNPNPFPGPAAITDPVMSRLGVLLNPDRLVIAPPQINPSHISGTVQLQVFPPTIAVPTADGESLTVRMNLMSRFFPDKNTAPLAEFMRGNLDITAPINEVISGSINVLEIDFKSDEATINFTPSYTSQPLSIEDMAGINLCIQNALQTSFLPSSVTLPNSIADVQLKTLPGALVLMLDLNDHPSTTSSVTDVFLAPTDDFAFAVGRDYLLNTFSLISGNIMSQTFAPVKFTVDLSVWGIGETLHYQYPIALTSASFDLQPGKIVLTVQGHAGPEIHHHPPSSFSFTVTVDFSLVPSGPTVELVVGNVSVSTSSTLAGIVDFFTGAITNAVKDAITAAIGVTGAGNTVNNMFNANTNLGNFLNTQFAPADGSSPTASQQLFLVYNSVDIQQAGIVLHGSLILFDWPAPYVEFEPVPQSTSGTGAGVSPIVQGTDYSALNTWIPGGTIAQYEWSVQGQEQAYPFDIDPNRFVLLHSGPTNAGPTASAATISFPGYSPLCLTITGTRISNFGSPPTYEPVTAGVCGYTRFPFPLPGTVASGTVAAPVVAITRPVPSGGMAVSGQTLAAADQTGANAPNLVVHFVDPKSSGKLQVLTEALARSNRTDAPTAVVAVLTPDQLSKAPYVSGVVYAVDSDGSWAAALGVKSTTRPLTLIVNPPGKVVWQKEGELEAPALASALTRYLVKRTPVRLSLPRLNARIGQLAPNFLFEYASGREVVLAKLFGQPIILVFWRSSVKPSIQAIRDLQAQAAKSKSPAIVMAVNDGEDPSVARGVAAENGLTAILVTDPKREISLGYGVSLWPTIVSIDKSGAIAGIKYGHVPGEGLVLLSGSPSTAAGATGKNR
jgi:peroxiredoxin